MIRTKYMLSILCLILFFCTDNIGQDIINPHEVISASGTHVSAHGMEMSWTVGEAVIATERSGDYILTQGFHQSEDIYLNLIDDNQLQLVITPNEDGLNDVFILEDILVYPDNEIIIVNRWGGTVFKAKPYLNDWDGKTNTGKSLPEGTYYYMLKLRPELSQQNILYGSITIKK